MLARLAVLLMVMAMFLGGCQQVMGVREMHPSAAKAARFDRGDVAEDSMTPAGNIRGGMQTGTATVNAVTEPAEPRVITAAVLEGSVQREVIYQGELQMVVTEVVTTQRTIQSLAGSAGGYLQELNGNAISVRVPAAKFEEVLGAIERLGEVTHRHVRADDVTESLRDLTIRLENARNTRKRLEDLLARSEKMEDIIRLEQELERVTQTIELHMGKLRYMKDQVAFSTIRATLNSPRPLAQQALAIPFAWVRELGDGVVAGITEPVPDASRLIRRNDRFTLPPGFVRYFERDYVTEAMSADDLVIRLRRQDNYEGGDGAFWMKLARRALVENRAIAITRESETRIKDGSVAKLIIAGKDLGSRKEGYLLGIVTSRRYVYAFEAWGPREVLDAHVAALEAALQSLDVKHW